MIPLFEIPWKIDRPALISICLFLLTALFVFLANGVGIGWRGIFLNAWLHRLAAQVPTQEAFRRRQRLYLWSIVCVFGSLGCFNLLVFVGVIRNGPPPVAYAWPEDADGLIRQLNEGDHDLLEQYERGVLTVPNDTDVIDHTHPEVLRVWVEEHRKRLNRLGYEVRWNSETREYEMTKTH